jgi:hypothetical protein
VHRTVRVAAETELVTGQLGTLDDGRGGGLVHNVAEAAVELRELAAQLPTLPSACSGAQDHEELVAATFDVGRGVYVGSET